jgi:hypothetical protein
MNCCWQSMTAVRDSSPCDYGTLLAINKNIAHVLDVPDFIKDWMGTKNSGQTKADLSVDAKGEGVPRP